MMGPDALMAGHENALDYHFMHDTDLRGWGGWFRCARYVNDAWRDLVPAAKVKVTFGRMCDDNLLVGGAPCRIGANGQG